MSACRFKYVLKFVLSCVCNLKKKTGSIPLLYKHYLILRESNKSKPILPTSKLDLVSAVVVEMWLWHGFIKIFGQEAYVSIHPSV